MDIHRKIEIIAESGLFDAAWYQREYPDVDLSGLDPIFHFAFVGDMLRRNPSPEFDSRKYLFNNPDVEESAIEPFLHYVTSGKIEGRDRFKIESRSDPDRQNANIEVSKEPHRLKVAVIAWDVGHNPLGRAYLLAEVLARRFEVVLLGPMFPRFGREIWEPLQASTLPIVHFDGGHFPEFDANLEKVASRIDCDVILVCKPRMPSLLLGLLMKKFLNRPLILDIDDDELSFTKSKSAGSYNTLLSATVEELKHPYSDTWTCFSETLIKLSDKIIVSNEIIHSKYSGSIIPHVRDERVFDPDKYDRRSIRASLGYSDSDRVILFAGTPRAHKGILETARAIREIGDPRYKLCIVGKIPDKALQSQLEEIGRNFISLRGNQPFEKLPEFLAAADLVCLIQNESSSISKSQLPAKLIDAIAMGVPVLATPTGPMRRFIESGSVLTAEEGKLAAAIRDAFANIQALRQRQLANRDFFLSECSYASASAKLENIIFDSLKIVKPLRGADLSFRRIIKNIPKNVKASLPAINHSGVYDIIVFWRQYDAGLYGRRVDMFAKYLAKHTMVRRVVFMDPPMWHGDLAQKGRSVGVSEHRNVFVECVARGAGMRDVGNREFRTFVYGGAKRHQAAKWKYPKKEDYLSYLKVLFDELGIEMSRAIFWLYPINDRLIDIVNAFKPKLTVCDIVDDQRHQPGITEEVAARRDGSYAEIIKRSDIVITNCKPIQDSFSTLRNDIRILPNAAEVDLDEEVNFSRQYELIDAIKGPKIGYVGNLESKVDADILENIARNRPGWNLILIGSTHSRPDILLLNKYKNVHFLGVVPYNAAISCIRQFDVAMMPHKRTPLTETMNPLKLFVYLSAGVQVVSTEVANIDELGDFVHIARDADEFVKKIEHCISVKEEYSISPELRDRLDRHSWARRVDTALQWVDEAIREIGK